MFFAISGLLIARSFDSRASIWHFTLARILRLWPALIVAVMLTAFVLGPTLSQLSPERYFSARETWAYVPTNLALVARQDALPGLFADNPYPHAVNGSLWSLFYEVACYLGLTLVGLLGLLRKQWSVIALVIGGAAGHVVATASVGSGPIGYRLDLLTEIGFAFALGIAAFIARDRLRLNWKAVALTWLAVALLWLTPLAQNRSDRRLELQRSGFRLCHAQSPAPLQRTGRLFLRHLHLCLPDSASADPAVSRPDCLAKHGDGHPGCAAVCDCFMACDREAGTRLFTPDRRSFCQPRKKLAPFFCDPVRQIGEEGVGLFAHVVSVG